MTEKDFINLIDCRFPYHDLVESQRLIELGCSISSNAAFMVVEELARVPSSETVSPERLFYLLHEIDTRLEHPAKDLVVRVARGLISGIRLSLSEVVCAMHEVATFPNQHCALNIIYFSSEEAWTEVDSLYDQIIEQWRVMP